MSNRAYIAEKKSEAACKEIVTLSERVSSLEAEVKEGIQRYGDSILLKLENARLREALEDILAKSQDNWAAARAQSGLGRGLIAEPQQSRQEGTDGKTSTTPVEPVGTGNCDGLGIGSEPVASVDTSSLKQSAQVCTHKFTDKDRYERPRCSLCGVLESTAQESKDG